MKQKIQDYKLLDFYEVLLLGPLTRIYSARKETEVSDWMNYSNLLIDKFAIQSSSFFHLSHGIIEHRKSGEKKRMKGLDFFTTNTIFRTLIEAYISFNHIYVEPKTNDEKYFRFLLWKLDGIYEEKKYNIKSTDFEEADEVVNNKENQVSQIISEIKSSNFIKLIPRGHLRKIFDPDSRKSKWKFLIKGNRVRVLQITQLIEHCCRSRNFTNMYKYTSLHTHSNFPAIAEFESIKGKTISTDYTNPITKLAVSLTCLFIYDICEIDQNARRDFLSWDLGIRNYINGISRSIKNIQD